MSIPLSKLLKLTDQEIKKEIEYGGKKYKKYKILLHTNRGDNGQSFIDDWLSLSDDKKRSGDQQAVPLWSGTNKGIVDKGQRVFSCIRYNEEEKDKWLFVSAVEILNAPRNQEPKTKVLTQYQNFFGRLIIDFKRPSTRAYDFNFCEHKNSITVENILTGLYS